MALNRALSIFSLALAGVTVFPLLLLFFTTVDANGGLTIGVAGANEISQFAQITSEQGVRAVLGFLAFLVLPPVLAFIAYKSYQNKDFVWGQALPISSCMLAMALYACLTLNSIYSALYVVYAVFGIYIAYQKYREINKAT